MRTTILNGNPCDGFPGFDQAIASLAGGLSEAGHAVTTFNLKELKIAGCVGCFACWLKDPGRCVFRDDQEQVLRAFVASDLVLFASPLIMGFTSALLKKCSERIVPVLLPYVDGASGECRHFLRYGSSPLMGVVYAPEEDTGPEDLEITSHLWSRLARNLGTRLALFSPVEDSLPEVLHATHRH